MSSATLHVSAFHVLLLLMHMTYIQVSKLKLLRSNITVETVKLKQFITILIV